MNEIKIVQLSRRQLMIAGCAAGFGLSLGACKSPPASANDAAFNSFVTISASNEITITVPDIELGQGVLTSLSKIIADELGASWSDIRANIGGGNPDFANPLKGYQATGRSQSIRGFYLPLRTLGAAIRTMLIRAAAEKWTLSESECTAQNSMVVHTPSSRTLSFGALAVAASKLAIPDAPQLREDADLTMIGKTTPRIDTKDKVTGTTIFGIDLTFPNMLNAAILQAPGQDMRVATVDETYIRRQPGVHSVVIQDRYVAVLAGTYYQAQKALNNAGITFTSNSDAFVSSAAYKELLVTALDAEPGFVIDDAPSLPRTANTIEATYWVPFLAHATMEPMTASALYKDGELTLWASSQGPFLARKEIAKAIGIAPEKITIHRPFAGGGFGRRFFFDFCVQAAEIAFQTQGRHIKMIWSREQDIAHDYYRPAVAAKLTGNLEGTGHLAGLTANISAASLLETFSPGAAIDKPDRSIFAGIIDSPYDIAAQRNIWNPQKTPLPIGMWRGVAHSQNAFFLETFLDECAAHAGIDPAQYRLQLSGNNPRLRKVIENVMELSDWTTAKSSGAALGVAVSQCYGSFVAQVAQVSVSEDTIQVEKVWCVIDCGRAIDPGGVTAQMESGIIFGLTAALYGEITFEDGAVTQSNFHDYPMLRMPEAPIIEVFIVNSGAKLGGVGEPGLPPIAPAVGNAIFSATNTRLRQLPFKL